MNDVAPLCVVGDRILTGLLDVTDDLTALDGTGLWAVVLPYSGRAVCARFERARPARAWPGPPWCGPARSAWTSSLDHGAFCRGVDVEIEFEPGIFDNGAGFLFATILDRFLALYTTLNSFTRTTARIRGAPEAVRTWPARTGFHKLV